ncbi:transglycosylase domain-containing protein [Actinacidiphila soli]|uniref:transglycosylase domain-containing protein n=1 Tax=Actinacidiphila soli TaxID=2487275 RepID=UPI002AFE01A4|nr:transglycosylase domain-containing protein [Actinacidiphila soli]
MSKQRHARKRPAALVGGLAAVTAFVARLSPLGARLSPFVARLSPLGARLSPFVARPSPLGARLSPFARRLRWEYPRPARMGWRRWMPSWRQWLSLVLFGFATLTTVVGIAYANTQIPKDLNSFATQQDNVYYWADGTEMARTGQVNRQEMPLSKVPKGVRSAVLAAENESFYSDSGVSLRGISRAVLRMGSGGDTQGGSTITQQYVKNAYLNQQQTVSRKATEIFIAIKLDKKMSKDQILQGYLNTSWFGRGTYGIQRAAQAYYGKDASELNVSEGAFLASLLKGAGLYDPAISKANRARAVERWDWILDRMVKTGQLSQAERDSYKTFPEPKDPPKLEGLNGQTGYLVETAEAYVTAHTGISDAEFALGGYQVHTTFEKPKVDALAASANAALAEFDSKKSAADSHVRAGAASVATDGRIVALFGGRDYLKQGFNDANSSIVPAGTVFTPFVYAAALEKGVQKVRDGSRTPVTSATTYDGNDKVKVMTPEGPYWDRGGQIVTGRNDGHTSWGPVTLNTAMVQSVNTPFIQLGMDVGLAGVAATATATGILHSSLGARVPAFSLGNSTPSAIRMADAYATFAVGGMHQEPYSVQRVTRHGGTVFAQHAKAVRAVSAKTAEAVSAGLRGSASYGAGKAAVAAGRGFAAKPGDDGGPVGGVVRGLRHEGVDGGGGLPGRPEEAGTAAAAHDGDERLPGVDLDLVPEGYFLR